MADLKSFSSAKDWLLVLLLGGLLWFAREKIADMQARAAATEAAVHGLSRQMDEDREEVIDRLARIEEMVKACHQDRKPQ